MAMKMVRAGRLVACAVLAAVVAVPPLGPARAAARAGSEPKPLDVVIAVDESGSLKPGDVQRETEAATTIGQSGLNPRNRIGVLGFGGATRRGQSATTWHCPLAGAASRDELRKLADCTGQIHRRSPAEGDDTDHVAALREALKALRAEPSGGALKTVFLLTDGKLDVSRSPYYGPRPAGRTAEAERQLGRQLELAQGDDTQIWPLGFGPDVDRSALVRFADGGSRRACDARPESRPHAQVVKDSGAVARALITAYAAASCFRVTPTEKRALVPGDTIELPQWIPGYASDATLTVAKGDPSVKAEFVTPDGRVVQANGTWGGSTYTRSAGNGGTVEALRVTNPLNGRWRVRLTAPPGTGAAQATATALYQGAIRSGLTVEPPNTVLTGRPITARLSVWPRRGTLTPQESRLFTFRVTARTPGGRAQNVAVRDDGRSPDRRAGDGEYAGTFRAPGSPGTVRFTGEVAGQGLRAEEIPQRTVTVEAPPTWLERNLWWLVWVVVLAVVALIAMLLARHARRSVRDVRDLRLTLRRGGGDASRELRPQQHERIEEFPFTLRDLGEGPPALDYAGAGDAKYTLRRAANRHITLERPDGETVDVTAHAPVDLGDGLRLVVAADPEPWLLALIRRLLPVRRGGSSVLRPPEGLPGPERQGGRSGSDEPDQPPDPRTPGRGDPAPPIFHDSNDDELLL